MHKLILLIVASIFLSVSLIADEAKEEEKDGVKVTIEKVTDTLKGFKTFSVKAENQTDGKKSVEIRIYLNDRNSKEPAGARGECTVFLKLDPNGSATDEKQCKEKKPSNSWSSSIHKVYAFHLE